MGQRGKENIVNTLQTLKAYFKDFSPASSKSTFHHGQALATQTLSLCHGSLGCWQFGKYCLWENCFSDRHCFSFLKNAWLKTNLKSPGQCLCHAAPRLTVRRCPCVTRNPIFVSETDDVFRLIRLPSWIFTYVRCTDTLLGINPLYLQWMKYKNIHNVYKINLVVFLFFYRGKLFI